GPWESLFPGRSTFCKGVISRGGDTSSRPRASHVHLALNHRRAGLLSFPGARGLAVDQRLCFVPQELERQLAVPLQRRATLLHDRVDLLDRLAQPLPGLLGMSELVMGHRQEGPAVENGAPGLVVGLKDGSGLVEPLQSLVELAGTVEYRPEDIEGIEIL